MCVPTSMNVDKHGPCTEMKILSGSTSSLDGADIQQACDSSLEEICNSHVDMHRSVCLSSGAVIAQAGLQVYWT